MSEDFLHYIWKFQLFTTVNFTLDNDKILTVVKQGVHNFDAGPDFLNAKIKIDEIEWNGSIEIHINSSDWFKHKHQIDKKYQNVILHVVWENDAKVQLEDNTNIPTLEIKELVRPHSIENYRNLMGNLNAILCEDFLRNINSITIYSAKERAVINRLEAKSKQLGDRLLELNNDWEQLTFERLSYCFGLKVNAENFETLAQKSPVKILQKHKGQLNQIEAILFGQAGYLESENSEDEYYLSLQKEYRFLKVKYGLETSLQEHSWNMLRLRPASFPTLRIALLASLVNKTSSIFSSIIEDNSLAKLQELVEVETSFYWKNHYVFAKKTDKMTTKKISKSLFELIVINAIVPILYLYGSKKGIQKYRTQSIELLEELKPEDNKIIRLWKEVGIENKSAFDSQALIELYNNSCRTKSCLTCNIGSSILQKA